MTTATAPRASSKLAAKFREMAERLEGEIQGKLADRRENTPKQQKEAACQRIDAHHLQRVKDALLKLADASERGDLLPALEPIKSKAQLLGMLRTKIDTSGGYYSVRDTGEYADQSLQANLLRNWLAEQITDEEREARAERLRQSKIRDLEAQVKFSTIPGFFPTPPAVIEQMLYRADIKAGDWVLEPSAGKGDIVDAILLRVPRDELFLDVLDVNHTLCTILAAKGHHVNRFDFLEWRGTKYDRIVMNPPFENLQDIDHVQHAYGLLKPGGRIVSVMSNGPFFRSDKKATEFRAWLEQLTHEVEDLPSDAFKDSFRSTGVSTKLVVIDKE